MSANSIKTKNVIILSLFLLILSVLQYSFSFQNEFVFDSKAVFLTDKTITDTSYLFSYFTGPSFSATASESQHETSLKYYWPVVKVAHLVEYKLWGSTPVGYNTVNILLNAIIVVLVFLTILTCHNDIKLSFWAAALYAVNPTRVEAVSWAYSDSYLIVALFVLLSVLLHIKQKNILSWAAFLFAMFSKESALLTPAIIIAYEHIFRNRPFGEIFRRTMPFFLIVLLYLTARYLAVGSPPVSSLSPLILANAVALISTLSLKSFFLPEAPITIFPYNKELISSINPELFVGYIVMGLTILCGYLLWKKEKKIFFWYIWFFIWLSIAFNVGQFGEYFFAEKSLFLAALGECVVTVFLVNRFYRKQPTIALCLISLLVASHFCYTYYRTLFWQTDITYFEEAAKHAPEFSGARYGLAMSYIRTAQYNKALPELLKTIELNPGYTFAYSNVGNIHYMNKNWPLAIQYWQKAIDVDPTNAKPYYNLAMVSEQKRNYKEALTYYNKYMSVSNDIPPDLNHRLQILTQKLGETNIK